MKPLLRIGYLIDLHEEEYTNCKGCKYCYEIEQIRKTIDRSPGEKFKDLLAKGKDLTKEETLLLLKSEVTKTEIRKAMRLSLEAFNELLDEWDLPRKVEMDISPDEIVTERRRLTEEEYKSFKDKGWMDREVAEVFNLHPTYITALKKKWRKQAEEVS